MVKVCAAAPAVADEGESVVMVGTGLLTTKFTVLETPPPGAGFVTTTGLLPAVDWSAALKGIVNCVALTKVGVCATALKVTVEAALKPVPLIVRVCAEAPTIADAGASVVIVGAAFVIVKLIVLDAPPPGAGLVTTTGKVPAVA